MEKPRRLCSEIQLFDLCDLETCRKKDGRFCTDPEVLERFEAIKEEDDRATRYVSGEFDEDDEAAEMDESLYDDGDGDGDGDYEDDL
jgi:hypothetical protein